MVHIHFQHILLHNWEKNFKDGANEKITGEQLLHAAVDTIKELQYMAGGMVIFLEAEDNDKLMHFMKIRMGLSSLMSEK